MMLIDAPVDVVRPSGCLERRAAVLPDEVVGDIVELVAATERVAAPDVGRLRVVLLVVALVALLVEPDAAALLSWRHGLVDDLPRIHRRDLRYRVVGAGEGHFDQPVAESTPL